MCAKDVQFSVTFNLHPVLVKVVMAAIGHKHMAFKDEHKHSFSPGISLADAQARSCLRERQ